MENKLEAKLKRDFYPYIDKPLRYTGTEDNIVIKNPENKLKILLVFPDIYEIGMAYQGYQIIYNILNKLDGVVCERAYLPHPNDAVLMREKNIPLFSLENKLEAKEFDIVAFTLSYELNYTNILECLSLAGLEYYSTKREENTPLIIAGGTNCYNSEPVADLFDFIHIGDAEKIFPAIVTKIAEYINKKLSKEEILENILEFNSIYVPSFYKENIVDGTFLGLTPINSKAPKKVYKYNAELKMENYPVKPLVPIMEITQDRLSTEVMRGCTRGCRFCQAGYTYRPVRERSEEDIMEQIDLSIKNTGLTGATLLSLSTSDYTNIESLIYKLYSKYYKKQIEISYPSMRAETFSETMADLAGMKRKSSFTFAPEVATDKMRKIVNKDLPEETIKRVLDIILPKGWRGIKLYFMIGLPFETEEDVLAIAKMINSLKQYSKQYGNINIHAAISPFNPKPFTPFQWVEQDSLETMTKKVKILTDNTSRKGIKLDWRNPKVSAVEAIISRGDRRLLPAIIKAHELGAKMDGWNEYFNYDRWMEAFKLTNIDYHKYLQEKKTDEVLPWDIIDLGITKDFYIKELEKSLAHSLTPFCREKCNLCGLEKTVNCQDLLVKESINKDESTAKLRELINAHEDNNKLAKEPLPYGLKRYRVKYSRSEKATYLSQLDIIRYLERNIVKHEIPLEYSHGFHPIPHIGFSHPLPFGLTSSCEYMDLIFDNSYIGDPLNDITNLLGTLFQFISATPISGKIQPLMKSNNFFSYEINYSLDKQDKILSLIKNLEIGVEIKRINKKRRVIMLQSSDFIKKIIHNDKLNTLQIDFVSKDQRMLKLLEIFTKCGEFSETEYYELNAKRINTGRFEDDKLILPEDEEK